jgi:hypothetical protein
VTSVDQLYYYWFSMENQFFSSCVVLPSFDFDFLLDLRPVSVGSFWCCGFISLQRIAKSLLCSGARTHACASRSSAAGSGEPFLFLEMFFSCRTSLHFLLDLLVSVGLVCRCIPHLQGSAPALSLIFFYLSHSGGRGFMRFIRIFSH